MKDWTKFKFTDDSFVITMAKKEYIKTTDDKWDLDVVETREVTPTFYTNYITSINFFDNFFGYGASCVGYTSKTIAGILPTKVITISPGIEKKIVATFSFTEKQ